MTRIFLDIPDVAFHKIARQYAQAMSRPMFTLRDQQAALYNYIVHAKTLN